MAAPNTYNFTTGPASLPDVGKLAYNDRVFSPLYETKISGKDVLFISMGENDSGATTIGGYLLKLLETLWEKGEGFSGKSPFGNSGWKYDLYKPLVEVGAVEGKLDSDGYIESVDTDAANSMIFNAIEALAPS